MRPAGGLVSHRQEPEHPRLPPLAMIDWLLRARSAIWLQAAGLADEARAVGRRPALQSVQDIESIWPALDLSARAMRMERAAVWHRAAALLSGDERWEAISDAAWAEAAGAACHRLHAAVSAAAVVFTSLDAGRAVQRTIGLPQTEPTGWEIVWDIAADASVSVAWLAMCELAERATSLPTRGDTLWRTVQRTARGALVPVTSRLDAFATHAGIVWGP